MSRGGKRPGSGRKPIAEELKTVALARNAIVARYGTLDKGLKELLDSGEATLIKFVFEHAFGKPQDKVDITSGGDTIVWQELKTYTKDATID